MQYIRHRINTSAELRTLQPEWGVEIDLRSSLAPSGSLYLAHDPWTPGEDFRDWLKEFKKQKIVGPIVLNTKEDGLEQKAVEALRAEALNSYFFLDTTLPTLIRWTIKDSVKTFAVRLSKFEPLESLKDFRGRAEWAWVDCFDGVPLSADYVRSLQPDFKICLVSPELQGRPLTEISKFGELKALANAICTKSPQSWIEL